jgi:hypothetical protein
MEETTQVAAFNTRIEVDVAAARLADEGIQSFITADNLGGTFPMMQMVTGGFKLHVLATEQERAGEVLAEEYEPIESRPTPEQSRLLGAARLLISTRGTRLRLALFVLTIVAVIVIAWSTTQGTL